MGVDSLVEIFLAGITVWVARTSLLILGLKSLGDCVRRPILDWVVSDISVVLLSLLGDGDLDMVILSCV